MASRFWVWWTGNWDTTTTTNWSATSGGAGGASVPTSSDDVTFNTASNATAYTVTVTATANCANLTIGNPASWVVSLAGSGQINIFGNSSTATGVLVTTAVSLLFSATSGTKTITSNGVGWRSITFNGVGGTFQLVDQLKITGTTLTLTNWTFSHNNQTVLFNFANTINPTITGAFTFYDLTVTGTNNTCVLSLASNITVSHTFTGTGFSVASRVLITSNTIGTARSITAASISVDKADFKDITGAWAASWDMSAAAWYSGDCWGNTMQALWSAAFTTAANQYYKIGASANWSTTANWFLATNGWGGAGRIPLSQDTAIFDANSITAGSVVITQDMPRIGSVNWTWVTNTPTWTTSTTCSVFGSVTLVSGMTLTASTQTYTFEWRSTYTLTNAGLTWSKAILLSAPWGTLTIQDNLIISGINTLSITAGTFDANNFNVTVSLFNSTGATARVLNMWSGTWTITGTGATAWTTASAGLTINPSTSTVKFTDTSSAAVWFIGSGKTYYNIWFARGTSTGSNTLWSNTTCNDLKDTGTVAHSLLFSPASVQHVTTFTVSGSAGNEITINTSSGTTTYSLIKDGWGTISCDYLNIQHSVATPSLTWYAGTHSTNNQAVVTAGSGIIFTAPPAPWANNSNFFIFM